ncbi:MAG: DUF4249 domain-containing protein [Arcicella sp.]|jgi:hypothetical protein|nr:DUF4249 domain-containing protein [Arcicella sp.]
MNKITIVFLAVLGLTSCQKEIDIDLNSTNAQVVIEGEITDQNEPYTVKITKTVNFTESNNYPAIKGANVTISDNVGNSEKLIETSAGVYQTSKLRGISGRIYTMTVSAEGKTYTAQSTMPALVKLEDIRVVKSTFRPPTEKEDLYNVFPQFTDPIATGNNYRFIQSTDKSGKDNTIIVANDNVENGQPNSRPIFSRDFKIKVGDILTLEMRTIDRPTYNYLFTLVQIAGNGPGGGTTPSNPDSNIIGGALGYFSAYTVQKKTIVVQ